MPLDTSTYNLALLRVDGRRWNELRRLHAQIRTQAAADGSSYLEMGNTKIMCVVTGPSEEKRRAAAATTTTTGLSSSTATGGGGGGGGGGDAEIGVTLTIAGFSTTDRKKRSRGDKRTQELQATIARSLAATLHTHLYPRSTISVSLHVLSQDGSLLAGLINAATLALVDAGIPMTDYLCACSAGSTSGYAAGEDYSADPLLDLNAQEETELPSLTLAMLGAGNTNGEGESSDKVVAMVCESRVQVGRLEGMMATAADGCKGVRAFLDGVVREKGRRMVEEGAVERGAVMGMDIEA